MKLVRIPVPGLTREVGAGDAVRAVTHAAGVEPCESCERRREVFNRWLTFAPVEVPQWMLIRKRRGRDA